MESSARFRWLKSFLQQLCSCKIIYPNTRGNCKWRVYHCQWNETLFCYHAAIFLALSWVNLTSLRSFTFAVSTLKAERLDCFALFRARASSAADLALDTKTFAAVAKRHVDIAFASPRFWRPLTTPASSRHERVRLCRRSCLVASAAGAIALWGTNTPSAERIDGCSFVLNSVSRADDLCLDTIVIAKAALPHVAITYASPLL